MDLQILLALGVLSFDALNAHINNLPRISTRLADMGLFQEQGLVGTTIVKVGINGTKLVLVPNVPRGAPGQPKGLERGKVKLLDRGETKVGEKGTIKVSLALSYYKLTHGAQVVQEIDVVNMIARQGGVDVLAGIRGALGI